MDQKIEIKNPSNVDKSIYVIHKYHQKRYINELINFYNLDIYKCSIAANAIFGNFDCLDKKSIY